jgi:hypothetical protein
MPDNYKVLFVQGGASTQFAAIPLNFTQEGERVVGFLGGGGVFVTHSSCVSAHRGQPAPGGETHPPGTQANTHILSAAHTRARTPRHTGDTVDYIVTGAWSKKAYEEAGAHSSSGRHTQTALSGLVMRMRDSPPPPPPPAATAAGAASRRVGAIALHCVVWPRCHTHTHTATAPHDANLRAALQPSLGSRRTWRPRATTRACPRATAGRSAPTPSTCTTVTTRPSAVSAVLLVVWWRRGARGAGRRRWRGAQRATLA